MRVAEKGDVSLWKRLAVDVLSLLLAHTNQYYKKSDGQFVM